MGYKLDNLKIVKQLAELRDSYEEDARLGVTIEGVIGFIMLILCILTMFFNSIVFGSILFLLLTVVYGTVMSKRIDKIRRLKRVQKFVKECKK